MSHWHLGWGCFQKLMGHLSPYRISPLCPFHRHTTGGSVKNPLIVKMQSIKLGSIFVYVCCVQYSYRNFNHLIYLDNNRVHKLALSLNYHGKNQRVQTSIVFAYHGTMVTKSVLLVCLLFM